MATEFAFWLSSQPSSVQIIVMTAMITTLVLCLIINGEIEKREQRIK